MTDYTKTLQPSGGDFSTLADVAAWAAANLVSSDTLTVTESGDWSSVGEETCEWGSWWMQPSGTSMLVQRLVSPYAGASAPTSANKQTKIRFGEGIRDVVFRGLQFTSAGGTAPIAAALPGTLRLENCLAYNAANSGLECGAGLLVVRNSVIVCGNSGDIGIDVFGTGSIDLDHVTTNRRFRNDGTSGTAKATNCIAQGSFIDSDFGGTWTGTSSNNVSKDGSAPGSGSLTGKTVAFVSGTYLLDASDTTGAKTSGVATSTTTDILGAPYAPTPSMGVNQEPPYSAVRLSTFFGPS